MGVFLTVKRKHREIEAETTLQWCLLYQMNVVPMNR